MRGMGLSASNPLSGVGMLRGGECRRLDFFFGILQCILDIKDLVIDLVHAVGEGAYVCVKVEIGVAIFTFCLVVELL